MLLIDTAIKSELWFDFIKNESKLISEIEKIANQLFKLCPTSNFNIKNNDLEFSIILTDNEEIASLNKQFRKKDKATNVLSFPAFNNDEIAKINFKKTQNNYLFLGDVILSYDKIKQESEEQNKIFKSHLIHLILHSILHLLGFDHKIEEEAKIMEDLEIVILEKLNISNPYSN